MKIGIFTIFGGLNYGNKLQNYALQQFLLKNGYEVETIQYKVRFPQKEISLYKKLKHYCYKYLSSGFIDSLWNIKCFTNKKRYRKKILQKNLKREKLFLNFQNTNLILSSKKYLSGDELIECNSIYDFVIVGSDQVWNPYWQGQRDEYFLSFMSENKRLCYAPSIGVEALPQIQQKRYAELLLRFKSLSCREKQGANLIYDLTNKECVHVVDPVFLLDESEWLKLVTSKYEKKYILTYFLGNKSFETKNMIDSVAKKYGLCIVDIYDETNVNSEFAGVEDFLSLIKYATLFFTDSFHGCAFSIIFHTPFYVCERKMKDNEHAMSSRITNILQKLQFTEQMYQKGKTIYTDLDFSVSDDILREWIKESKEYLLSNFRNNP